MGFIGYCPVLLFFYTGAMDVNSVIKSENIQLTPTYWAEHMFIKQQVLTNQRWKNKYEMCFVKLNRNNTGIPALQ